MELKKICIIMPAHNEEKRIGTTLKEYGKFFGNLRKRDTERINSIFKDGDTGVYSSVSQTKNIFQSNNKLLKCFQFPKPQHKTEGFGDILDWEILVIINNTTDRTQEIVEDYSKKYKEIRYLNFKQGGKGFAIKEGFKEALKNEKIFFIGFVDADLATIPDAFYELIKNIKNFDGIIASRYVRGAIVEPKQSIQRIFVSRVYNFFIRSLFLLPYKDTQCGCKIFRRHAIEKIINKLTITKWAFDVDLIYCLRKNLLKIKEFPTVWSDKEYSKINFMKAGPLMALSMIRLRVLNSPLKDLARLYDKFPEWMKIHHKW